MLDSAGHDQVWVAVLEEGEVPEDEAASQVAGEAACGSLEIRVAAGGTRQPVRHGKLVPAG